jgi:hypothetical protein
MGPLEITGNARLLLGLVTGIAFGFFLQKGGATKYDKIVGALRLKDLTIIKLMLTAILVGMVGVYLLHDLGLSNFHIKPLELPAVVVGSLIFGVGFALLGFCPGTCAGAVGEGRIDGLFAGILGLIVGATLHAEIYPFIKDNFMKTANYGKLTIPEILGLNPWAVIIPLVAVLGGLMVWSNRKGY